MMNNIQSDNSEHTWDAEDIWDYAYTTGPPVANTRAITLIGPGAFDGVIADRLFSTERDNAESETKVWETSSQKLPRKRCFTFLQILPVCPTQLSVIR